ncbi:MAG: hypothetical protein E6X21_16705 [Clostridium sp.]|uniref:hypothetical protein n=1 Tax=Clostridium sp. TaxID=1506 RepID=UPI002915B297|nr:hypothetical protein [Clostridium sp.]
MYKFCTTERNNAKANEYETKAMLYLLSYRKDSDKIDTFLVDCFNDITGSNIDVTKLWDIQSKNVKSLYPSKIGISLITLFQNYISDIDFAYYILFMPKLKEMYLHDESLSTYTIDNFLDKHKGKVSEGLKKEYQRRNGKTANKTLIEEFLKKVYFVVASEDKVEYIKNIIKFKNVIIEDKFFIFIFNEIRDKQTKLKNIDIEGKSIEVAKDVLQFEKTINRNEIDILIINRFVGVDLFSNRMIPNLFFDEIKEYDKEERKDIIKECNAAISKVIFNKNNKKLFWIFFEGTISLLRNSSEESPRQIYEELKRKRVKIPLLLDELSVIYLISVLKESLENDN